MQAAAWDFVESLWTNLSETGAGCDQALESGSFCQCKRQRHEPGSPFRPNLRALVIYQRFTQGIAFLRLVRLLSGLALVNMHAAKDDFAKASGASRARLLRGTILQSDETGLRVGKKNGWLWVFHHDDGAVFIVAPSRGKKVDDFLGDFRPDFWVPDRYGGQMGWAKKDNQVCLAHLIRDVQYAIDAGDGIFAPDLRLLLGRVCRIGRRRDPENLCRAAGQEAR